MSVSPRLKVAMGAAVILILSALLAFHHLGANSLFGDETIFAMGALEAAEHGQWYPLSIHGHIYVSKPPLALWPMALHFRSTGLSELHARIDSAVAGVLVSLLLFALGAWLVDAYAGAIAAMLLITAPPWLLEHGVREGVGDIATTLFTGVALFTYVRGRVTGSRNMLIASACAAAAGSMIKGPVVLLLLASIGAAWEISAWLLQGRAPRWRVLAATVIGASIPFVLWITDSALRSSEARSLFWSQYVLRHTKGIDPAHLHSASFYPRVLFAAFGWWLLALLLPMLWSWLRTRETALLLPVWAFLPPVLYSISPSKLAWYLDPALPALALLIGVSVRLAIARVPWPIARVALLACVAVALALRTYGAGQAVDAPTQRTDLHQVALAYRAARHPALYLDDLTAPLYGFREWNAVYLDALPKAAPHIPAHLDRSRCTVVVTLRPAPLLARADFAGATVRLVEKRDARESDLFVVDLCGGHFTRAMAAP